ncbi:hypothetical protein [Nonomuraea sp. JJY05]|uniref:hypothetical protein n=1 Tax=Nonomuraea sp. JJY05 TaxID=3350255 RepID=UPI00373E0FF7
MTLLAAYLLCRGREITDALVDLLIVTVHRINARAETKVIGDFVAELKRVPGKENIPFKMTEAALEAPEERVEDVIYPAVSGGHQTLVSLLHECPRFISTAKQPISIPWNQPSLAVATCGFLRLFAVCRVLRHGQRGRQALRNGGRRRRR